MTRLWTTAAACALAAGAATAQETVLPTLSIEASANEGFFGETFAQSAGSVMKTDTPIIETPRSVSVVTQQQIQDRGARNLAQALQYTPGVTADNYGMDNRGDWVVVRGFDATIFLDGLQSYFGYYNNARPEAFLLESISVLKGPAGMLYGNGTVGGAINAVSKLPEPGRAEHRPARIRQQRLLPVQHRRRRRARRRPDAVPPRRPRAHRGRRDRPDQRRRGRLHAVAELDAHRGDQVHAARLLAEERHEPDDPVPVALRHDVLGRGLRRRPLPRSRDLHRRAELRLLRRRAHRRDAVRRAPVQRGLGRSAARSATPPPRSTTPRPTGPTTTSTTAATTPTARSTAPPNTPRTTRIPGSAMSTPRPTSASARPRTTSCSATPSPTGAGTTTSATP